MRRKTFSRLLPLIPALVLAALLGAAELGLRLTQAPSWQEPPLPQNFEYAFVEPTRPYFRRERRDGAVYMVPRREGSLAAPFRVPKPAGTTRIFVIGGSVTLPLGYPSTQMPDAPWRELAKGPVELITLGMSGYDSRRDLGVLREALRHEPDAVFVMSGNNEFYRVDAPHPELYRLNRFLRRSRLVRTVQDGLTSSGQDPTFPFLEEPDVRFEPNLRAMAAAARAAGVPLAFCTLPANLRDIAPASQRGRVLGPRRDDRDFAAGWRAFERGDWKSARAAWTAYRRREPRDPFGAYYLAKAADRLGLYDEARPLYAAAADLTAAPDVRCPPRRNEAIRRTAAEAGAGLVDLERLFASLSPQGILGLEVMYDTCHWKGAYYPLVITEMLTSARALGAPIVLDDARVAFARARQLKPVYTEADRAHEARKAMRAGVMRVMNVARGLDEQSLSLIDAAYRLAPSLWKPGVFASPSTLMKTLREGTGGDALAGGVPDDGPAWDAVWIHIGESFRRRGARELSAAALKNRRGIHG